MEPVVSIYKSPPNVADSVELGDGVFVGSRTAIKDGVIIGAGSLIGQDVVIGPRVQIDEGVLIMDKAIICPNDVNSVSSNGRSIEQWASVGPGVLLHDEVELGPHAIVPTQRTIAHLGNLGSKNRVVTIYGSDSGPRISIGCQVGVTIGQIRDSVAKTKNTSEESAGTYGPFLDIFEEIGKVVQGAYDIEGALIQEIRDMRKTYKLDPSYYGSFKPIDRQTTQPTNESVETAEYVFFEDAEGDHEE